MSFPFSFSDFLESFWKKIKLRKIYYIFRKRGGEEEERDRERGSERGKRRWRGRGRGRGGEREEKDRVERIWREREREEEEVKEEEALGIMKKLNKKFIRGKNL